ncbi:hypothetical protein F4809DRAFT_267615 [Biscogniauxia mediterranea]|nr:hypothetical protein F4809DRAFT_267615 [Biscogniauxia mediterranea]
MAGFLVPPWFKKQEVSFETMSIASFLSGFMIAFALFTAGKAASQTRQIWRSLRRVTAYVGMIWGHWLANVLLAVLNWCYLWDCFEESFWVLFFPLIIWVFQTQLIVQIIINRVALLMTDGSRARRLKWTVFGALLVVNAAVFCVWIPAALQISPRWIEANRIWDRIEKCIFLLIDASLNLYFVHLVRTELVANGLTKYTRLYRFNLGMISVSISMDCIMIGLMSMPNILLFIQFQSIAYLIKLYIEMKMADLIKKIVTRGSGGGNIALPSSSGEGSCCRCGGRVPWRTDGNEIDFNNKFSANGRFVQTMTRSATGSDLGGGTHAAAAHVEMACSNGDYNQRPQRPGYDSGNAGCGYWQHNEEYRHGQ